jgi:hypothetical protein
MKDSSGREPRWNADRWCAPRMGARPCPSGTAEEPCVCRRFASESFPFVLSFVIAGLDPAIHAEVTLEKRFPPSVCLLQLSMDHRHRRPQDAVLRTAMPGGNESESAVTVVYTENLDPGVMVMESTQNRV